MDWFWRALGSTQDSAGRSKLPLRSLELNNFFECMPPRFYQLSRVQSKLVLVHDSRVSKLTPAFADLVSLSVDGSQPASDRYTLLPRLTHLRIIHNIFVGSVTSDTSVFPAVTHLTYSKFSAMPRYRPLAQFPALQSFTVIECHFDASMDRRLFSHPQGYFRAFNAAPVQLVEFSTATDMAPELVVELQPSVRRLTFAPESDYTLRLVSSRWFDGTLAHKGGRRDRIVLLGIAWTGFWRELPSANDFLRWADIFGCRIEFR